MTRVAITGWALASPFGRDADAFWRGLCNGPAPMEPWHAGEAFPSFACQLAALPADCRPAPSDDLPHPTLALAAELGREALASAGFDQAPAGLGLALGSLWGGGDYLTLPRQPLPQRLLPKLARRLSVTGPMAQLPVACAAANVSLTWACDQIRSGGAPFMLAGGMDLVGNAGVGAYLFFGTLTEGLPRPFGVDRDGFLLGEGGAMFLLEPLEQARAAGRRVIAEICGVGGGHDASHPTRPAVDGRGLAHAMRRALADAGLTPADIGYVNAHSPGTQANDPGETAAIHTIFGPQGVPVSSSKAALGHAQGGANALEAVACILALRHQLLPPTLNVQALDPELAPIDLVVGEPRPHVLSHALSLASSMGGATSAVIFGRGDA